MGGAAEVTYRLAIRQALRDAMRADESVVLIGEDVAVAGGVFKVTEGLLDEFGSRVRDTPISEVAITGAALGAALAGLRPVVEIMFADFVAVAMDQLANQIPKYRYTSGGQVTVPLVVRAVCGAGMGFGAQHSGSPEAWFVHTPGWRIVAPSNADDAYWLLRQAIESNDPVLYLEHKNLYNRQGRIGATPQGGIGRATVVRAGGDVTVVATMMMVERALEAAELLATEGVSVEVIDLRGFAPWDRQVVMESVSRTRRLLTVEESPRGCGWGAEVVSTTVESIRVEGVRRVTGPDTPIPYSPVLEAAWIPRVEVVAASLRSVIGLQHAT